ncbi:MAG: hypothetical protein R8P61_05025 [Bacteroidia bacterium]|nr:hypothetical protein [Bacteroidia bacterium]
MNSRLTYILTLASFGLLSSSLFAQSLIPLDLGNQWVYHRELLKDGEVIERDTVRNWIDISFDIAGKEYYSLHEFGDVFVVRNSRKGQFEIDTLSRGEDGKFLEVMMFRKPHKKKVIEYQTFGEDRVKVYPTKERIQSIAGDFDCIKYEILPGNNPDRKIETYVAPGIGIVFQKWKQGDKEVVHRMIAFRLR